MKHGAFGEAEQMSENNRFNVSVRLGTREPLTFNRYCSYALSELQIVIRGSAIHHMQERSAPIRENDVLLLHPGMQNYFTDGSDDFLLHRICYNSKVPPPAIFGEPLELFQHLYPGAEQPGYDPLVPVTHVPDYDHELYLNLILRLYYECTKKRLGHKIMVPTMFVELLVYLARGYNQNLEPGAAWRLEAPAAYLARHFDAPLDLPMLAKLAGMSERNLFRHFKQQFGMSPRRYLERLRIQNAMRLLRNSDCGREEIAMQCGFCDGNHLSRVFQKVTGCSCLHFRRRARETKLDSDDCASSRN